MLFNAEKTNKSFRYLFKFDVNLSSGCMRACLACTSKQGSNVFQDHQGQLRRSVCALGTAFTDSSVQQLNMATSQQTSLTLLSSF